MSENVAKSEWCGENFQGHNAHAVRAFIKGISCKCCRLDCEKLNHTGSGSCAWDGPTSFWTAVQPEVDGIGSATPSTSHVELASSTTSLTTCSSSVVMSHLYGCIGLSWISMYSRPSAPKLCLTESHSSDTSGRRNTRRSRRLVTSVP